MPSQHKTIANKSKVRFSSLRLFIDSDPIQKLRKSRLLNIIFSLLVPLITMCTLEWIARGSIGLSKQDDTLNQSVKSNFLSFVIAYVFLILIYIFISRLTGRHAIATVFVGLLGNVPAAITYYKLTMRGEPFLPWDLIQIGDFMGIKGKIRLMISPAMVITILIFVLLTILASLVKIPPANDSNKTMRYRIITSGVSFSLILAMLFGVFLNRSATQAIGIKDDAWLQDRYYRTNGVITGFLTNMQVMQTATPTSYGKSAVQTIYNLIKSDVGTKGENTLPPAVQPQSAPQTPDIIYIMGESFWDVTSLNGIEYDREIFPNLESLKKEAAYGYAYTPSFGGGTCDVEFEALTGFSMEHLPAGSKPFQQYINEPVFSLPNHLKSKGYSTLAIHGFGRDFWSRDTAYPLLGIDTFIAKDNMEDASLRRGFISDDAMIERIMLEHTSHMDEKPDTPMFIHAVTMQNHGTYGRDRYPEDELVRVIDSPETIPDDTIGQLEDCATSMNEMDAAIGKLVNYLRRSGRPTIIVFWGDHLNPMSDGYKLFEETGLIAPGDISSPNIYKTPLLIWSNYSNVSINLGTLATYNLTPVMMDLYALEAPPMFKFLQQQFELLRGRTKGVTISPDGTYSSVMTTMQRQYYKNHAMLQYDLLFGSKYLNKVSEDNA